MPKDVQAARSPAPGRRRPADSGRAKSKPRAGTTDCAVAWRRRKPFRKAEIIEAAVGLIVEIGIDDVSIIDIARRAGISEATVYKYFGTRHDVVARALTAALTPLIDEIDAHLPLVVGCRPRLAFFIARVLKDMVERPNVHRATYTTMRHPGEYQTVTHGLYRRFGTSVLNIFRTGVENGELRSDTDCVLASDMVFGGLESIGWRTVLAAREMRQPVAEISSAFADQLLHGIAKPVAAEQGLTAKIEALLQRLGDRDQ